MADNKVQGDATPANLLKFQGRAKGKGDDNLNSQPGWAIKNDGFGLLESNIKFRIGQEFKAKIPKRGDKHPGDPRLFCYLIETAKVAGGLLEVSASYCGIEQQDLTEIKMTMSSSSSTDPIETHPNFKKSIGGTPSAPLNGAVFIDPKTNEPTEDDLKGVFQEFPLFAQRMHEGTGEQQTVRNKFAGVKNFYNPGITLKGEFYTKDTKICRAVVGSVGYMSYDGKWKGKQLIPDWAMTALADALNNINAEDYYQDRNFLMTSTSLEQYGVIYKVGFEITLGGLLGWIQEIYPRSVE